MGPVPNIRLGPPPGEGGVDEGNFFGEAGEDEEGDLEGAGAIADEEGGDDQGGGHAGGAAGDVGDDVGVCGLEGEDEGGAEGGEGIEAAAREGEDAGGGGDVEDEVGEVEEGGAETEDEVIDEEARAEEWADATEEARGKLVRVGGGRIAQQRREVVEVEGHPEHTEPRGERDEGDERGGGRLFQISRRFSRALPRVISSTNSSDPPTGTPCAMRVTFTPSGLISRLR